MTVRARTTERRNLALPIEVAEFLRVEVKTLKQWRWLGVGPRWTKANGAIRYRWDDVETYLDEHAEGGAA